MRFTSSAAAAAIALSVGAHARATEPSPSVLSAEDVDWQPLNPARGEASPRAGTLWGDRNGSGPTGFLVQFVDGFSSPPHIHNVSYRGIVITGLVHNDAPEHRAMWMPAASYWTQPKGATHITAAKGSPVVAYIEIDEGPYLVHPVDQASETAERPVNVDASNLVWLDVASIGWMSVADVPGAKVTFLWGNPADSAASGALIELSSGFTGSIRDLGGRLRSVVVRGAMRFHGSGAETTLEPGSYFTSTGGTAHRLSCVATEPCILYVRSEGKFLVTTQEE